MDNARILEALRGGLIVSCQALDTEPLYDPERSLMGKMAYAAKLGGAVGIRANSVRDILDIRKHVDLPIIGIIKHVYPDSPLHITASMAEVDALAAIDCQIIATDATDRIRPHGQRLDAFFAEARAKYPHQLFMADCATYEEGVHAAQIGFDIVSTTLCGYAGGTTPPDFVLMRRLVAAVNVPVIAEGGIWEPWQLKEALNAGVHCAVIGSAITRPMEITKRFVAAIQ